MIDAYHLICAQIQCWQLPNLYAEVRDCWNRRVKGKDIKSEATFNKCVGKLSGPQQIDKLFMNILWCALKESINIGD